MHATLVVCLLAFTASAIRRPGELETGAPAKFFLLKSEDAGHVPRAEMAAIEGMCKNACGKGVDSSCVPNCQVAIYTCMDANRQTEEGKKQYAACEKKAIG